MLASTALRARTLQSERVGDAKSTCQRLGTTFSPLSRTSRKLSHNTHAHSALAVAAEMRPLSINPEKILLRELSILADRTSRSSACMGRSRDRAESRVLASVRRHTREHLSVDCLRRSCRQCSADSRSRTSRQQQTSRRRCWLLQMHGSYQLSLLRV